MATLTQKYNFARKLSRSTDPAKAFYINFNKRIALANNISIEDRDHCLKIARMIKNINKPIKNNYEPYPNEKISNCPRKGRRIIKKSEPFG